MAVSDQAVLTGNQLDTLSINTIRTLSIDAVQKANSGHPGVRPGCLCPVATVSALRSGKSRVAES